VADLAARSFVLAVEVNPGLWHPREQVVQPLVEGGRRRFRGAQHIGHHRHRHRGIGIAEWVVEHRAQMLLELAGPGAIHGPVPGVVRAHREFVDQQLTADRFEQLDRQDTDDAEFGCQSQRELLGGGADLIGQRRRRGEHQHADAVALHRLDDRPGRALAERGPRHQRGELATHRDALLDQYRYTRI
jgi:hypothetical protein